MALASNERALHDLSQAHGRTGLCSGQTTCCRSSPDGPSGRVAGRKMHISGWFALLTPLLWPFLAMLSFFQRLHVVKAFQISSESPLMTGIKAILCMPCSLWQVRTFLDERQCEEKFRMKVNAEEREKDSNGVDVHSQSSPSPYTWSPGLPHRVYSMTSDDARGIESRTSAPGTQAMPKQVSMNNRSFRDLGSWQPSSATGHQVSGLSSNSKRSSDLATPSVSQCASSSGSSYQEVTAAFIPSSTKQQQPQSILASVVVQHPTPRISFNSSPRHKHFDERHVYIPDIRDPSSSPAPWTGDKVPTGDVKPAHQKPVGFQLPGANSDAHEQEIPRVHSPQEQVRSLAVQRWMRIGEMKSNIQGQADSPVTNPSQIPSVLEPESETVEISEAGERESYKQHGSTEDTGSKQGNQTSEQPSDRVAGDQCAAGELHGGAQSPTVSKDKESIRNAIVPGTDTTIKGGKGWSGLRKKPLSSLNTDLWEQASQASAHRRELAAAATSPKVLAGDSASGLESVGSIGQGAYPESPSALPRSGSLSTHRPDPVAAAAVAKSLRSRQQDAWKKAFDGARKFRGANSKQPLQQLPEGIEEDHSRSGALANAYQSSMHAESDELVLQSPEDPASSEIVPNNRISGDAKPTARRSGNMNRSDTAGAKRITSSTHESAQPNSPQAQAAAHNAYEQLSQHVLRVTENMSAIMDLGSKGERKGSSPGGHCARSQSKRSQSGGSIKRLSARHNDHPPVSLGSKKGTRAPGKGRSLSPMRESPSSAAAGSSPHSNARGNPLSAGQWNAGNVFTYWWGANSCSSSPTSGTDRPDSPDVLHRNAASSDYKPPTDNEQPSLSDMQSPAGSTGAQPPLSSPRFGAVLTGSTMQTSRTRYVASEVDTNQESSVGEASGNLDADGHLPIKAEKGERSVGLAGANSASVPKRPGERSIMQAISSAMDSAINSFSMMSQKQVETSTELTSVAPSRGSSQYQSSFIRGGGSSMVLAGRSMPPAPCGALSTTDSNSSFTSDDSTDASGDFQTPVAAHASGSHASSWGNRMAGDGSMEVEQTLAAFADSAQLAAPTRAFEDPVTFSALEGGDDDTPTAQFFDGKLHGSKARPPTQGTKTVARNNQFSLPGQRLDPRADGFWTSGGDAAAVNKYLQPSAKPPKPPDSLHRSHNMSSSGSRPPCVPGVTRVVEDSGVLEIRPASGSRQMLWHTHSSGYSAEHEYSSLERVAASDGGSQHDQPATDASPQPSGDEGTSSDTRHGLMIRRLSDVIRNEHVPLPETNANNVDIAKIIESHANGTDLQYYSPTPSQHGGSISDLEF